MIVECTFGGPCENREQTTKLKLILSEIQKPSGAYDHNREKYLTNVIESCIEKATEALKLLEEIPKPAGEHLQ